MVDHVIAGSEVKARAGEIVELEVGHAVGELGGFFGVFLDFWDGFVALDAASELFAEASFFADIDPVIFAEARHLGSGGFAGAFEVIVPNGGDGEVVEVPEFVFVFGAVGGFGGVARIDGVSFAVFVEKIREADFDEDVVFFDVFFKVVFVFDDGVFKGDTIGTNEI